MMLNNHSLDIFHRILQLKTFHTLYLAFQFHWFQFNQHTDDTPHNMSCMMIVTVPLNRCRFDLNLYGWYLIGENGMMCFLFVCLFFSLYSSRCDVFFFFEHSKYTWIRFTHFIATTKIVYVFLYFVYAYFSFLIFVFLSLSLSLVETMRRCRFFFNVFGLELPDYLSCHQFSDSNNPDICVGNKQMRDAYNRALKPGNKNKRFKSLYILRSS